MNFFCSFVIFCFDLQQHWRLNCILVANCPMSPWRNEHGHCKPSDGCLTWWLCDWIVGLTDQQPAPCLHLMMNERKVKAWSLLLTPPRPRGFKMSATWLMGREEGLRGKLSLPDGITCPKGLKEALEVSPPPPSHSHYGLGPFKESGKAKDQLKQITHLLAKDFLATVYHCWSHFGYCKCAMSCELYYESEMVLWYNAAYIDRCIFSKKNIASIGLLTHFFTVSYFCTWVLVIICREINLGQWLCG